MINKIAIVRYTPYTESISFFFSIDCLIKSGIEIDYLDVSLITTGESGNYFVSEKINVHIIHCYKELSDYIKMQDRNGTLFIPFMSYFHKTFRCFYLLSKYNCKLGYCLTGFFPAPDIHLTKKIIKIIGGRNIRRIYCVLLNLVCNFIKNRTSIIKASDIVYYSGSKAPFSECKFDESTRFVKLNSIDYERFLVSKKEGKRVEKDDYIVFIDQYLPFHSDAKINGLSAINPDSYYKKINQFFERMESHYGLKVVIAAHPKAIGYKEHNYFDNRTIYWGVTDDLVKYANVVVMHFSTSVSFSVLYKKPIYFISMSEIRQINLNAHNLTIALSGTLGAIYYYLDDCWTSCEDVLVDKDKYRDYKYSYLTSIQTEYSINGLSLINSFSCY